MNKERIYCPYCQAELNHQATDEFNLFGKKTYLSFFDCVNCKRRLYLCEEKDIRKQGEKENE